MPKLFSYGTLQQEDVQLATFGRRLTGVSDALVGYRQSMVAIDDPEVVRTSGKTHHPIVAFTGASEDRVAGMVFEISDANSLMPTPTRSPLTCGSRRRWPRAWTPGSMSTRAASFRRDELELAQHAASQPCRVSCPRTRASQFPLAQE